MNNRWGKQV